MNLILHYIEIVLVVLSRKLRETIHYEFYLKYIYIYVYTHTENKWYNMARSAIFYFVHSIKTEEKMLKKKGGFIWNRCGELNIKIRMTIIWGSIIMKFSNRVWITMRKWRKLWVIWIQFTSIIWVLFCILVFFIFVLTILRFTLLCCFLFFLNNFYIFVFVNNREKIFCFWIPSLNMQNIFN